MGHISSQRNSVCLQNHYIRLSVVKYVPYIHYPFPVDVILQKKIIGPWGCEHFLPGECRMPALNLHPKRGRPSIWRKSIV